MKRFAVIGLILFLATPASAYVMADHPRLYNPWGAAWQTKLNTRATTTHSTWYDVMDSWVTGWQAKTTDPNDWGNRMRQGIAPCAAMCGIAEDDSVNRRYAIDILLYHMRTNPTYWTGEGQWTLGQTVDLVVAYDWMYPYMTQVERDSIGVPLGAALEANGGALITADLARYPWIPSESNLQAVIALYGDTAVGGAPYLPNAATYLEKLKNKATYTEGEDPPPTGAYQGYLGSLDEISGGGAVMGYSGVRYGVMLMNVEALKSSIGDSSAYSSPFMQNIGAFWQHRLRSDNALYSNIGKSNPGNPVPLFEAWAGSTYGDSAANGMARTALAEAIEGPGAMNWDRYSVPWIMLWYKPWLGYKTYPDTLTFYDPYNGTIMARDYWLRSPLPLGATDTTSVTHLGFYCGPNQSDTGVWGHLYLSRGRDALLTGSNGYNDIDTDLYYYLYGAQGFAYNTLSIFKDGEDMGTVCGPGSGGSGCITCGSMWYDYPEDGQQTHHTADCEAEKLLHYPKSAGTSGYGGEMEAVADNATYLYARAEMTSSFKYQCTASRATSVKREVVWMKPIVTDGPSILVVRDLVTRVSGTYPVKARWHVLHRPELPGGAGCSCMTVVGADWNENLGGVYEVPDNRELSIITGDSEAQMFILDPAVQTGTLRIFGGPNADGDYWKQDWQAGCANYAAGKTSYEFYLDGKNYVSFGDHATRQAVAGAEAADWTIEIQAEPSPLNEVRSLELLYLFVVGATTQPRATAVLTTEDDGFTRRVTVTQGHDTAKVNFTIGGYFTSATRE